jgi:hypothetical protein
MSRTTRGPELSQPYKQALNAGLFKYLKEMPWAMTVREMFRDEENGFLKEFWSDMKKSYRTTREKYTKDAAADILRNQIIRPAVLKERITRVSLANAGEAYFSISLSKRWRGSRGAIRENLIALKDITEKKVAIRILLEYWSFFLGRDIENASNYFKIIYYIGENEKLSTKEIKNRFKIHYPIGYIASARIAVDYKSRPALIQKIGKAFGGTAIWALTPFFQEVWDTAMSKETLKKWDKWKKVRSTNINWIES